MPKIDKPVVAATPDNKSAAASPGQSQPLADSTVKPTNKSAAGTAGTAGKLAAKSAAKTADKATAAKSPAPAVAAKVAADSVVQSASAGKAAPATRVKAQNVSAAVKPALSGSAVSGSTRNGSAGKSGKPLKSEKKVATKSAASSRVLDKAAAPTAKEKPRKPKLVRDSFTMPETEYAVLSSVKKQCIKAGFDVKKSELLRVGVALIKSLGQAELKKALAALPPLKVGRPKAEK